MNLISFKQSLTENNPPQNISVYLKALWQEGKGNWDKAHVLVQDLKTKTHPGFMLICIAKKATLAMRIIGIAAPVKKDLMFLWKKNGKKL